jgi:hypothetical protein
VKTVPLSSLSKFKLEDVMLGQKWNWQSLLVLTLCLSWSACSTAWIGEAEQIVAALIPGIANVLTLVATLQGKNVSAEDVQTVQSASTQAEGDLRLLQSLVAQYQKSDGAEQQSLLVQIQDEVNAIQRNLNGLLPALHIKDAATAAKITAVVGVLVSETQLIIAILPAGNASASKATTGFDERQGRRQRPLSAKEFVTSYNATMTAKTGETDLDNLTAGLQIHLHGKFARWASAGILK